VSFELPRWASKLLAVALSLAVLGASYLYIVSPVLAAYRNAEESLVETRGLVERYEGLALGKAVHQDRLEELRIRQTGTGSYLSGATDALAAAELQERIRGLVIRHGGQLRSIQNLPARSDGGFRGIAVRVQFSANLSSFHLLLYELESEKPFVFVDNLDVRNRRGNRQAALKNLDPQLTIRFDLSGYLRPETQQ
jgi:general secretion pathway protein M